jgi:hypothetical protein
MTHTLVEPHVAPIAHRADRRRRDSRFYTAMGIVAFVVALVGFNGAVRGTTGEIAALVRIHAVLFTAWLALFITQSRLVATGRIALHRRLGLFGAALAATMIVVGYRAAIDAARRGFKIDIAHDPLAFLVFPLGDLLSFAVLVALALWYRKRPMAHKRLMLLATCGALMNAPLAHFLAGVPALAAIPPLILLPMAPLLGASAVYDKVTLGKIHPVSLWGALALFIYANLRAAVIGPSAAWHSLAGWLVG